MHCCIVAWCGTGPRPGAGQVNRARSSPPLLVGFSLILRVVHLKLHLLQPDQCFFFLEEILDEWKGAPGESRLAAVCSCGKPARLHPRRPQGAEEIWCCLGCWSFACLPLAVCLDRCALLFFAFGGARVFSVDACGRALSLLVVRSHRSSSPSGRSRRYVQAGCALRSLRPLEFCVCPLSRRAVWRVRAFGARCVRFVPLRGCRVRAGRVRRGSFGSIACVWFSAFSGSAWNRIEPSSSVCYNVLTLVSFLFVPQRVAGACVRAAAQVVAPQLPGWRLRCRALWAFPSSVICAHCGVWFDRVRLVLCVLCFRVEPRVLFVRLVSRCTWRCARGSGWLARLSSR